MSTRRVQATQRTLWPMSRRMCRLHRKGLLHANPARQRQKEQNKQINKKKSRGKKTKCFEIKIDISMKNSCIFKVKQISITDRQSIHNVELKSNRNKSTIYIKCVSHCSFSPIRTLIFGLSISNVHSRHFSFLTPSPLRCQFSPTLYHIASFLFRTPIPILFGMYGNKHGSFDMQCSILSFERGIDSRSYFCSLL